MAESFNQPFGEKLVAGARWKWTVSLADYPADTWKLIYAFRGKSKLDVISTASGTSHLLDALPAATTALESGSYALQVSAEKLADPTERYELARGMVEVLPDIFKAGADSGLDFRSENRQVLDRIRATIKGTASREEKSYQLGGRALEVHSPAELMDAEGIYAARVRTEEIAAGTVDPGSNMVHVRFGAPS